MAIPENKDLENWYEKYIEPEIRDVVRLLRNNGVNTECSCGHQMWVQFQVISIDDVDRVDKLLTNSGYRNFSIEATFRRLEMRPFFSATVYFTDSYGRRLCNKDKNSNSGD